MSSIDESSLLQHVARLKQVSLQQQLLYLLYSSNAATRTWWQEHNSIVSSFQFQHVQFAQYVMRYLELGHAKLPRSDFSRACQRAANPSLYCRHGINTIVRELCRLLSSNTGLCAKPDFKAFLGLKLCPSEVLAQGCQQLVSPMTDLTRGKIC